MKKVLALGLIALFIVIVGYVAFLLPETTDDNMQDNSAVDPGIVAEDLLGEEANLSGNGSLLEIKALNRDLECTIITKENSMEKGPAGSYFVSGERVRGDFLIDAPDLAGKILTSIIIDESYLYTWSEIEGEQYGTKMSLKDIAGDELPNYSKSVDLDSKFFYNCSSWPVVDNSIFVPPPGVLFQDMSMLMNEGLEEALLYEE